ncbi:hypothetical protein D9757_009386 [Collybiopsis confluens]|uniref:RNA-dependent RNA polymerase n=1 Tax=Collybiopsis confluens TaxID=2823264 RepID=A0A8H5H6S2_9AGAR|nr:hypothetical protein D9757_009386 [Collybiopsis confluens]
MQKSMGNYSEAVTLYAQNSDDEDLAGSDTSTWMETITRELVNSPLSTPKKPWGMNNSRPGTMQTIRASELASASTSTSPLSHRSFQAKRSHSISARTRVDPKPSRPPIKVPVIIISSDEEDAGDTESESDSDSIFSKAPLSRENTMSSTTSFPSPVTRSTSMSSDGFSDTKSSICRPSPYDHSTHSLTSALHGLAVGSSAQSLPSAPSKIQSVTPPLIQTSNSSPKHDPLSLQGLFPSNEVLHLGHHMIAHDVDTQALFDNPKGSVPWGTQFVLARGVQMKEWNWRKVQEKIHHFAGKSDAEVLNSVEFIMKDRPPPKASNSEVGYEFDREQLAILEGEQRGLGLMGNWQSAGNWFGGQIQQIVTLEEDELKRLRLRLEPLEMRRSTRLTRKLGSRRVLQVRIADDFLRDAAKARIVKFLARKFILNGRVFVPTPPKESAVYLVEIDEDFERAPSIKLGDDRRKSLGEILEWHNPMALNSNQARIYYPATLAALALSNSVPALIFEVQNIHFIDDIIASDCEDKKPPAHKVLTDGCGFINQAALKAITEALNYPSRPTAVQGRIAGSKGLWTLHPVDTSDVPQIWIRDSQRKIIYSDFDGEQRHHTQGSDPELDLCHGHYTLMDRAHRIFDLVHAALPSASSSGSTVSISKQSVLNLWANGVKESTFEKLMGSGLAGIIEPLFQWESGPMAMPALWDAINKIGKVSYIRTSRLAAGKARALGLAGRSFKKDGTPEDDDATGRNNISGEPSGLHEKAIELVQAGFHPSKDAMLWESLKSIVQLALTVAIEKCSIPLPEGSAAQGYVITDPLGILGPDQIFYRSSTPMKDPDSQTLFNVVTGDVLIGRYPFRVRSDIQKVEAVDIPQLYRYSDVIIVPTKPSPSAQGLVSLMSKCSGGDHDGDELFAIWEKVLVEQFKACPLVVPPEEIASSFEKQVKKVDEFQGELAQQSLETAQKSFITTILGGLADSGVGLYDSFHEKAVRLYGYDSKQAERLAFLFNDLLDASKTGKVLRADVRTRDRNQDSSNQAELAKSGLSSRFIYDQLQVFGQQFFETYLARFDSLPKATEKSNILRGPYVKAQLLCETAALSQDAAMHLTSYVSRQENVNDVGKILQLAYRSDLELIKKHVNRAYGVFAAKLREAETSANRVEEASQVKSNSKKKPKKVSQKRLMEDVVLAYASDIPGLTGALPDVEHVKASYAYERGKSYRFAELVAFRSLCQIQVDASSEPGGAPCLRILDEAKSISGGVRRLL